MARSTTPAPPIALRDSAQVAPKSIVIDTAAGDFGTKPTRAFKDEVIYEVHVRGLTRNDPSVPAAERGTYLGAGKKAAYLKSLGVTAIELLPVQETLNDDNDVAASTTNDNYWGYIDAQLLRARPPLRQGQDARRPDARVPPDGEGLP